MRSGWSGWRAGQRAALAGAMAVGLAACASFEGIAPTARQVTPEFLTAGPESVLAPQGEAGNWPADQWWKILGDPQLDALIERALAEHPSLRIAQARLARARAVTGQAEAAAAPSVDLNFDVTRERFSENSLYGPYGGPYLWLHRLTFDFSYDLDLWGRHAALIKSAGAAAEAAEADAYSARLALTTAVARTWIELQRLNAQRAVTQSALRQREHILELTQQRVRAGLDTYVELREAEGALPEARLQLARIEENIALTRYWLASLVAHGPDAGLKLGEPAVRIEQAMELPANVPVDLIGRRPDLVAARWQAESAAHGIQATKAEFYPNINLMAFVGLESLGWPRFFESGSQIAGMGPALSLPLFTPGPRNRLRARVADYDIAIATYNQTLLDAVREVADLATALRSTQGQMQDQQLALEKSRAAYELALQRFRAGLGDYLTVLTAESAVLTQQRADADLSARLLDLQVRLMRALGGGYVVRQPGPVAAAQPAPNNSEQP